ncbi:MAG: DnaJ domain-containing protein [Ureaplasma sp.]|nr:DnaJ domain-containing protein [Ureaplasma sp.]
MNQDFPFILLIYGSKDILLEVQKELKNNFINSFIKTQSEFEELIDDSNNYEINDAYKTLELNKNASLDEIKSAYRKLAKKYHPDLNKSTNAEEMFRKVNNAYNLLLEYLNSK